MGKKIKQRGGETHLLDHEMIKLSTRGLTVFSFLLKCAAMKVCIISERQYGNGASIAAHRFAKGFAHLGHEVHYVYSIPAMEPDEDLTHWQFGHPLQRYRLYKWYKEWNLWEKIGARVTEKYLWKRDSTHLREIIDKISPDVINLHNVASIVDHDMVRELSEICPVIWTMHDQYPLTLYHNSWVDRKGEETTTWEWSFKTPPCDKKLQKLLNSKAPIQFVTPSKWLFSQSEPILNNRFPIKQIHNGICEKDLHKVSKEEARRHLSLPKDRFFVLFVSFRLDYDLKNIFVLSDALKKLDHPNIELIAVGKATEEFQEEHKHIWFAPHVQDPEEMKYYYAAADVLAVPSLVENLPNTILESFFCGTPVIGSPVGGIPEMVIPDKTGWLIDPKNPDEVAELLGKLVDSKDELNQVGQNCLNVARENYSLKGQCEKYLQIFNEMI